MTVQPVASAVLQQSVLTDEEGFEVAEQQLALKLLHQLQADLAQAFVPRTTSEVGSTLPVRAEASTLSVIQMGQTSAWYTHMVTAH